MYELEWNAFVRKMFIPVFPSGAEPPFPSGFICEASTPSAWIRFASS